MDIYYKWHMLLLAMKPKYVAKWNFFFRVLVVGIKH